MYAIEVELKTMDVDQKLRIRRENSLPLLEKFYEWLVTQKDENLPNSPTGKAIKYTLSNWEKLTEFSRNGLVPLDKNYMEAHIRPFTFGRKPWMFSAVPAGANANANLYTLVESAKANRI